MDTSVFCKICHTNIGHIIGPAIKDAMKTEGLENGATMGENSETNNLRCAFCFGLLNDNDFMERIADQAYRLYSTEQFDGNNFVLALNMPTSQLLRELIVERLSESKWAPALMSPKELFSRCLMDKLAKVFSF